MFYFDLFGFWSGSAMTRQQPGQGQTFPYFPLSPQHLAQCLSYAQSTKKGLAEQTLCFTTRLAFEAGGRRNVFSTRKSSCSSSRLRKMEGSGGCLMVCICWIRSFFLQSMPTAAPPTFPNTYYMQGSRATRSVRGIDLDLHLTAEEKSNNS